jgi:hypothetical protein
MQPSQFGFSSAFQLKKEEFVFFDGLVPKVNDFGL